LSYINAAAGMYQGQMTIEDKAGAIISWQNGKTLWMVSTSTFGTGIHDEAVRFVASYSPSASIEDYHPE
jgi:superfamily II DNA helicase RecQ